MLEATLYISCCVVDVSSKTVFISWILTPAAFYTVKKNNTATSQYSNYINVQLCIDPGTLGQNQVIPATLCNILYIQWDAFFPCEEVYLVVWL